MMKCSLVFLILMVVFLPGLVPDLRADMTLDYKTSISGIPFLSGFEMQQITAVRSNQMASSVVLKMTLPDSAISERNMMLFDVPKRIITICTFEDSTCLEISLSSIDSLLEAGFAQSLADSLRSLQDKIRQYFALDTARIELTAKKQKVQGYNCRELAYNFSGYANIPVGGMGGTFRLLLRGSSWVTEDIPNFKEYRENMNRLKTAFFTPRITEILKKALEVFNIESSVLDSYLDVYSYIYVSTAVSMRIELWSPDMDAPSMTFEVRINSVLQDIAFDKLSDEVFQLPSGFEQKRFKLNELFEDDSSI